MSTDVARASAPASVGNVGVGFDVLGLAFDMARDVVTATRENAPGARLGRVDGLLDALPEEPAKNTALSAADALLKAAGVDWGARLDVRKGVPLSAGMGGSAASATAAAAAVNALLPEPYPDDALLPFAMAGERASSDPPPWDNVAASLHGGLVLVARLDPPFLTRVPTPTGVTTVLFHPARRTETAAARGLLSDTVPLDTAVEHARRTAAFMTGCATDDADLIAAGLEDVLVEPQRLALFPDLPRVQAAARKAGALGCSFSGSGPSVFAWTPVEKADAVEAAMARIFADLDLDARAYRASLDGEGVRLEPI